MNKDGAVQTLSARVLQGATDFNETLFVKCLFEPSPFLISKIAVDDEDLVFERSFVDLSLLVQESMVEL